MANRFWVGGTGTWDSTTTTNWATGSGLGGGASAPIAGDNITFDGASGGGVVTPNSSIDSIAFGNLTAGAFTGTLAFNTNNPNMSFAFVSLSGTGTRTINLGSGTWTLPNVAGSIWDVSTTTGLTAIFSNATVAFTGASSNRVFNGGSQTYAALTVANNSTKGTVGITGVNTFGSMTVGSGNTLQSVSGAAITVTGALNITGTSSAQSGLMSTGNPGTVTVGSASSLDWCAVLSITKAGAGSITATNSLDLGRNTSVTITVPSGGGSSGGGVIGS